MKSRYSIDVRRILLIGGLAMVVLVLTSTWWRDRCLAVITYPLLLLDHTIMQPTKRWWLWRQGVDELQVLSENLLKERNELLNKLIVLKGTRDYLVDCAECLEFKKRYEPKNALVTQVLLRQCSDAGHYFYIDAGENRGIKNDMVAVYENCLVGKVSEVYPHYSKVMLITDKECKVAVHCLDTGARGIHSGLNDAAKSVIEFVNHLDVVRDGDMVVSHGEGLIFPRGFAVGKVVSHELEGVQCRIYVEPSINLKNLEHCLLLLDY